MSSFMKHFLLWTTVVLTPVITVAAEQRPAAPKNLTEEYRESAARILGAAMTDEDGWEKLVYLTTEIGNRLSGSEGLEEAIEWASAQMESEGLKVTKQPVKVPHWVRGKESLAIVLPRPRRIPMLGLGGSIGTGPGGVRAEAVVVRDFDELEARGRESIEGKIVVYAVDWEGYGKTVRYRGGGASKAAEYGAVAALVRSATGRSLATPHTGGMRYEEGIDKIPTAAITPEDADWMRRLTGRGGVLELELHMDAETRVDADSFNVIADITGSTHPEEVVVMGGHFDSWDVGQGAHDDGAACIAAWHALTLIHRLGLTPKRTLRVVLWTNEENGLRGALAYREWVADAIGNHVAAIEMDGGAERPIGFGLGEPNKPENLNRYENAIETMQSIGRLFDGIDAGQIVRGGGGADIGPLMRDGVPGIAFRTVGEHYFDWHHTEADTLDKVEPDNFKKAMAMLGVLGFVLADMPERLDTIMGR